MPLSQLLAPRPYRAIAPAACKPILLDVRGNRFCIALLITSFVLAHGKVDLIVPAFLYSVRLLAWWFQAGRPLNDETIAIPITTAVIAVVTLSAMRFGYKAGFKPGIKQTRGKLIVPPSQLYVVAYGKHNAGINIAARAAHKARRNQRCYDRRGFLAAARRSSSSISSGRFGSAASAR